MQTIIIDITRAESLAKELSQFLPSRFKQYPAALVIAAAAPHERSLRAANPSPHSKWIDALNTLAREIPGNPADCEKELYRLADAALGAGTVSQYLREFEAKKRADAAAEELRRIQQEPAEDAARAAMMAAAERRSQKHQAAWSASQFDAAEAQAKKTILDLWGKADSPHDHSLIDCAFTTLSRLPVLRELSKIALG